MKKILVIISFLLFNVNCVKCQISPEYVDINEIHLKHEDRRRIISLMNSLDDEVGGKYSDIKVFRGYLEKAKEIGDYGPMYIGDTITVMQSGFIVSYTYDKPNTIKGERVGRSNEVHCDYRIFFPDEGNKMWVYYFRRYGFPPSYGYSSRWVEKNDKLTEVIKLIKDKIRYE